MGWKAKRGKDVLGSIAARLLALADLADRVAGRSFLIRWLALWYIWRADAVVREFVAGSEWNMAGRLWSPALPAVRYGTDPADARALAVSLRALAVVVLNMDAERRRLASFPDSQAYGDLGQDRSPPAIERLACRLSMKHSGAFALSSAEPHDTS